MGGIKYPSFIEAPATAIIGQKCFRSLLENLDFNDRECIKYAVSKALGLGIVVGGSIVKIPQVMIIQRARSAQGLSVSAFAMELISCAISTVYNVRNGYAFSTYGENAFLTLQNAIITLQILHYQPTLTSRDSNRPKVMAAGASMLVSFLSLYLAPLSTLTLLQGATIPISAIAKIPQIVANERNKSTGTLSAIVVIANIVGCLARVFTTITEVNDPLVLWGFILSSLLNVVIGIQLWAYWGNKGEKYGLPTEKVKLAAANVQLHAPKPVRAVVDAGFASGSEGRRTPPAYSPARGSPAPGGGRRWARKLD